MTATAKRKVRVHVSPDSEATPAHLIYRTTHLEASIGYQLDRNRVTWMCKRADGSTGKLYDHKEGVRVCIGEQDWQHSGVYLGIYSKHRLENGAKCEGAFEDFISLEQLDHIIELLQVVRAKADSLGILTPREIPKTRIA